MSKWLCSRSRSACRLTGALTRKGEKIKSRLFVPAKPILLPMLLLNTADCKVGKRRTCREHVSFKRVQKTDLQHVSSLGRPLALWAIAYF